MSKPTSPPTGSPDWCSRLRGDIDRCTHWRDVVPLLKAASGWEAVAKHRQDVDGEELAVALYEYADQRGADLHDVMLLRDVFTWRPLARADPGDGALVRYTLRALPMRAWAGEGVIDVEVARLSCVGGIWRATLDRHRAGGPHPVRDCTSYEAGRLGVELWAARHYGRLHDEVRAMRAGHPSGSWDECLAPGCTRGDRLLL